MKRKKRSISDKERLDWLSNNGAVSLIDGVPGGQYYWARERCFAYAGRGRTVREAIDAAIRAERASRKESK